MPSNIVNGTDFIVKFGTAGSEVAIAFATSASISFSMETRDISNKSSAGWRELLEAQRSWSVSCENLFAWKDGQATPVAVVGYDDLWAEMNNRTSFSIVFTGTSPATGETYYSGTAYLTSLEASAPLEDNTTFTASFEGSGVLTETTA
tara:strand:+ start:3618 stop:4061 length:444 start_codon:yes stop_codon:yes gene_type:complete